MFQTHHAIFFYIGLCRTKGQGHAKVRVCDPREYCSYIRYPLPFSTCLPKMKLIGWFKVKNEGVTATWYSKTGIQRPQVGLPRSLTFRPGFHGNGPPIEPYSWQILTPQAFTYPTVPHLSWWLLVQTNSQNKHLLRFGFQTNMYQPWRAHQR